MKIKNNKKKEKGGDDDDDYEYGEGEKGEGGSVFFKFLFFEPLLLQKNAPFSLILN